MSLDPILRLARGVVLVCLAAICCCISACSGDNPVRYQSTLPASPSGVTATAGDQRVTVSWSASSGAGAYRLYYRSLAGVTPTNGTSVDVQGTSWTVTGLDNGSTYHFVVTAVAASGESAPSAEVSATPAAPAGLSQQDLEGVWHFNILGSGPSPGWMRGAVTVGSGGTVLFTLYEDSFGNSTAPAGLLPSLVLGAAGAVSDGSGSLPGFRGDLSTDRLLIVGSGPWRGSGRYLAVLQKQQAVPFVAADLQGFGNAGGGARRFLYHQISAGAGGEWEWAAGQVGRDQTVQYAVLDAPSHPALPGKKATFLDISSNGIVRESLTGAGPVPAVVMDRLVMSGDKTLMAGVATDSSRLSARYVLRIYQMINIRPSDTTTFAYTDLPGSYHFQKLVSGTATVSASGLLSVDAGGSATYGSYADSAGGASASAFSMLIDTTGIVTGAADPSLHGKLSYLKDMLVLTRSEPGGNWSMTLGLKK